MATIEATTRAQCRSKEISLRTPLSRTMPVLGFSRRLTAACTSSHLSLIFKLVVSQLARPPIKAFFLPQSLKSLENAGSFSAVDPSMNSMLHDSLYNNVVGLSQGAVVREKDKKPLHSHVAEPEKNEATSPC